MVRAFSLLFFLLILGESMAMHETGSGSPHLSVIFVPVSISIPVFLCFPVALPCMLSFQFAGSPDDVHNEKTIA